METAYEILRDIQLVEFLGLGLLAIRIWFQRRDKASAWLLATFGVLAVVVVAGRVLPETPQAPGAIIAAKFLIAVLVLFPYCLYRFVRLFVKRPHRSIYVVANTLTAGLIAFTFFLPKFPKPGDPRPPILQAWILLLLAQWVFLSAVVGIRLWRAGKGQATVARRRMRTMSVGAVAFAVLLVVSGTRTTPAEHNAFQIVTQVFGIVIAPFFILGFATPQWVVALWRRKDEQALRLAEIELVKATSPDQVAAGLLPQATRMIGANASLLYDFESGIIGSYGLDVASEKNLGLQARRREKSDQVVTDKEAIWVPFQSGWLIFLTSAYTPFFGKDEANTLQALGVLTDLALAKAELFERERLQKEAMQDFIAIASHDLRTPITIIEGFTTTLLARWQTVPDPDKMKYVSTIDRQVVHLKRLVEDLLTVSKIEGGGIDPQIETIDLHEEIHRLIADLGDALPSVDMNVEPGLQLNADPDHLHRMLTNYLRNSARYGAPPISIDAQRVNGFVEIRVADQGTGVPEEFVPRLFGKFERAHSKTSSGKQGTGLGLSIVRGLARASGGDAWYEPNEPVGAIFGLRLPGKD